MPDALQTTLGLRADLSSLTVGFDNFALNQSTDAVEWIFQAPAALTLTRLFARLGTITGTTPIYRISLQGVNASGDPDGTIKGATNNALKTFSPSALGWAAGSANWLTLDESYACSRGEMLAIVIDYSSGTVDGSNNASFTDWFTTDTFLQFPYSIQNNNGSRTRTMRTPCYGYGTASTKYGRPLKTTSTAAITSSSNPREIGWLFTIPAWWTTETGLGVRFAATILASGSFTIRLYDGTTVLQSVTIDSDHQASASSAGLFEYFFDEATLSALTAGAAYRIAFENLGATSWTGRLLDQESGDDWDAWPFGSATQYTSRPAAGSWTDDDTKRWMIGDVILGDITVTASGGGPRFGMAGSGPSFRGVAA